MNRLPIGIAAFVVLMLATAWLVHLKLVGPEAFTAPVGLFVGWLTRQPVEMRTPKLPKLPSWDEEDTKP